MVATLESTSSYKLYNAPMLCACLNNRTSIKVSGHNILHVYS